MRGIQLSAIVIIGLVSSQLVHAAPIPWSNPNGTTPGGVIWTNGQNETNLMGSPTPVGNTFFFVPQGFIAESVNGQGLASASDPATPGNPIGKAHDRVDVDLQAPAGQRIQSIRVFEAGDFGMPLGSGTVSASGALVVTPTQPVVLPSVTDPIHTTPAFPVSGSIVSATWSGNATTTFGASGPTKVHLSWDNNLLAATLAGANDARIEKQSAFIGIEIIVPEPASIGFLACGAPLMLRRRRSN